MSSGATGFLESDAFRYLREGGAEVDYADGTTIVHRGDPGRAFYVVVSGVVEVVLTD